jgi:hypothetical protein
LDSFFVRLPVAVKKHFTNPLNLYKIMELANSSPARYNNQAIPNFHQIGLTPITFYFSVCKSDRIYSAALKRRMLFLQALYKFRCK